MNNSLLKGTTWYWRQGRRQAPMHSGKEQEDTAMTKELYMPVKNESQAQALINELDLNGIRMSIKRTHSTFDVVPVGTLIIFAPLSLCEDNPKEEANVEKLRKYILDHEGIIDENSPKISPIRSFLQNLFGRK